MENFLTFDLENWYDSEFVFEKNQEDFIVEGLNKILPLLNKHKIKATFFITGKIIEKYPKQIKKLHKQGHEIASHSYEHIMLNKMKKEDIEKALKKSQRLIKKITGKNPKGFRAPSWSIDKENFWVYEILSKLGFKYSSSVFPINMGLYGSSQFPVDSFKPLKNKNFTEFPNRPFKILELRTPFSGGVYFRILPKFLIKFFIKRINQKKKPVILYLHPWEFCENLPHVKTNIIGKVTTYWGLKRNKKKLDYILSNFKFCPLEKGLKI